MLRAITSLLLLCFSYPLIAPALLANAASPLPACCERAGKHHCAMPGSAGGETLAMRCPQFPQAASLPAGMKFAQAGHAGIERVAEFSFFAAALPDHSVVNAAQRGPVNKRGPPSF